MKRNISSNIHDTSWYFCLEMLITQARKRVPTYRNPAIGTCWISRTQLSAHRQTGSRTAKWTGSPDAVIDCAIFEVYGPRTEYMQSSLSCSDTCSHIVAIHLQTQILSNIQSRSHAAANFNTLWEINFASSVFCFGFTRPRRDYHTVVGFVEVENVRWTSSWGEIYPGAGWNQHWFLYLDLVHR